MTDTPQHIKDIQLKIWLSRPPMERLKQMMEDNAALAQFWGMNRPADELRRLQEQPEKTAYQRGLGPT